MSTRNPSDFTVSYLKEKLRELGLPSTGSKIELIARLDEADPTNRWMSDEALGEGATPRRDQIAPEVGAQMATPWARELDMIHREKELAERELEVARRELEIIRESHRLVVAEQDRAARQGGTSQNAAKVSITAIADLLACFDGSVGGYKNWEKQLALLRTTYQLADDYVKILIGMRLKGKALEWLHSKPQHIELSIDTLLSEMREMYDHRPGKIELRRQFEERTWKKEETFHQYAHEKVVLANRAQIDQDEIVDYLIDGIPVASLRDQARIGRLTTKASLLQAFEKVTLGDRGVTSGLRRGDREQSNGTRRQHASGKAEEKNTSRDEAEKRCFNCGKRNHMSPDCPTKAEGPKCFQCGERGHIASKCGKRQASVRTVSSGVRTTGKKPTKEVELDGHKIVALIDTGSDICLLRSDHYIEIGSPRLDPKKIRFQGIGSSDNRTLGEYEANLKVDGNIYPILVRVVSDTLLNHEMVLGTDFLNTIELSMKAGQIAISSLSKSSRGSENLPEIYQIDLNPEEDSKVDLTHVTDVQHRNKITELIANYSPNKSRDMDFEMTIILKDKEPVCQRARRLSASERELVNEQVSEWIRDGIVQPSLSEYASPVVLAKKKNNSIRLCVDYRLLNKKIVRDRYPLPLIEDQLDALQNARLFSTLDLKNGFFHVAINKNSRECTAFVVPDGHYEFLRVPFGLCNSPAVFQRFINIVFKDLIRTKTVLTYMDDLIIPSATSEEGITNLRAVLKVASEAGLTINWRKCSFLKNRVEFLGHIVEDGRVYPSEDKAKAVRKFPEPTDAKQLQSFLGLSGYFRKFIPRYSTIARPLSDLLKANVKFNFGVRERAAFIQLKEELSSNPVLSLYVVGAETELHTDASALGYGAILEQEFVEIFHKERDQLRENARERIAKVQRENKRGFDKNRKAAIKYREGDLVAIERTQRGPGLKIANRYLGPYQVTRVLRNDRYMVQREGEHEGPYKTSTAADHMKQWVCGESTSEAESEEDIRGEYLRQNGRV